MSRRYVVTFENVSVGSAVQDLVTIFGAAGVSCRIIRAWWGCTDTSLATSQSVQTRCRLLPATVTPGSAGSTPTPRPCDPTDAAATFTAHANDTTKTTTNGTATIQDESGDHVYNGYRSPESWLQGKGPAVRSTSAFVFELLSSVSGTAHMSGGVEVEEQGA